MLFWVIIATILLILIFILDSKYIALIWILLGIISAFRYNVGTDYESYSKMYDSIINGTASGAWLTKELGYVWLIYAVDYIGGNFQLVCAIMSFLTLYFMYKGFRYFTSDNYSHMLLVTFLFIPVIYFYTLNFIRQALVVAIFLFAIRYIVERRIVQYSFFIFIALMFHKSAIILFPLYWVLNMQYSKRTLVLFTVCCCTFFVYNPIDIIMNFFVKLNLLYSDYFVSDLLNVSTSQIGKVVTIFSVILFILFSFIIDTGKKKNILIINAMMLFLIIRIIALDMKPLNRIASYFNPFFVLFFVIVLQSLWGKVKNTKLLMVYSFMILSLCSLFAYVNYLSEKDGSYNQYAFNICVTGKSCPLQVYGDYRNMYFKVGK